MDNAAKLISNRFLLKYLKKTSVTFGKKQTWYLLLVIIHINCLSTLCEVKNTLCGQKYMDTSVLNILFQNHGKNFVAAITASALQGELSMRLLVDICSFSDKRTRGLVLTSGKESGCIVGAPKFISKRFSAVGD